MKRHHIDMRIGGWRVIGDSIHKLINIYESSRSLADNAGDHKDVKFWHGRANGLKVAIDLLRSEIDMRKQRRSKP
jgi:hypothetical protein